MYFGALPFVWNTSVTQLKNTNVEWLDSEVYILFKKLEISIHFFLNR
jgi:hypothetical protein